MGVPCHGIACTHDFAEVAACNRSQEIDGLLGRRSSASIAKVVIEERKAFDFEVERNADLLFDESHTSKGTVRDLCRRCCPII